MADVRRMARLDRADERETVTQIQHRTSKVDLIKCNFTEQRIIHDEFELLSIDLA